jgi:hypothetical protein
MWYASRGAATLAATLALYAIWFVARHAPRSICVLIVALAVAPFVLIAAPDLLAGGQRSALSRYLTPSLIAAQLAVAYLLSAMIGSCGRTRISGMVLAGLLLSGGAVSDLIISQTTTWRNKGSQQFIEMAGTINAAPAAPVLVDASLSRGHVIALSRYLHPQVRIEFACGEGDSAGSATAASDGPPLWLVGFESSQQRRGFESPGGSSRLVCDMFPPLWRLERSS